MIMSEYEPEEPKDPLAEYEASEQSDDPDSNESLCSVYDCADFSSDSSSESADAEDEEPTKKSAKLPLQKSEKSYEWETEGIVPKLFSKCCEGNFSKSAINGDSYSLDPFEIFSRFFTDPLIRLGAELTNQNGTKFGKQLGVTEKELQAFIGMLIIMGFHRLPNVRLYWNSSANFNVPRISDLMSLQRFLTLLKFVCFYNVNQREKREEKDLYKIRPLLEHMNEKFLECGKSSKWFTVDKSSIQMRNLRSVRITVACCPETGYLYRVHVRNDERSISKDAIILDLLSPFEGEGVSVVLNRRFTSFPLAEALYTKKIFVCAEIRQIDPNIPIGLRDLCLESTEGDFLQSRDFSITKWRRKKNSYVLSTMHDASEVKPHFALSKRHKPRDTPLPVADYYSHRQGVTIYDSLRSKYSTIIASRDWTTRFFFFMLESAVINSYIIYKSSCRLVKKDKPLSVVQFRSLLADQLTKGFTSGRRRSETVRPSYLGKLRKPSGRAISLEMQDVGSHMPERCATRRCAYCSTKKHQRRSTIACSGCNVALCLTCFAPFHLNRIYIAPLT